MTAARRGHDDRLLDQLGAIEARPYEGSMWRVARTGRSPIDGSRGAGRWNTASMSVLYGAQEADGAIAEVHFHLSRGQPVFPSRLRHDLHELRIRTTRTLFLPDMASLTRLGVEEDQYQEILYARTQEIAAAAAFLGFDGIIAPSARWSCLNIILFLDTPDAVADDEIEEVNAQAIDWPTWRADHESK